MKDGVAENEVRNAVVNEVIEGEALNEEENAPEHLLATADELDAEGIRLASADSEPEEDVGAISTTSGGKRKAKGKKTYGKDTNIRETQALNEFMATKSCRRVSWNMFFKNAEKCQFVEYSPMLLLTFEEVQLVYGVTTTFKPIPGMRECDNCMPERFPIEVIEVAKGPGLKRGKKRKMNEEDQAFIQDELETWREEVLRPQFLGSTTTLAIGTVLGDDIISKIVGSGEHLLDYTHLRRHALWAMGHNSITDGPNDLGKQLINKLNEIYHELDDRDERVQQDLQREQALQMDEERRAGMVQRFEESERQYSANTQGQWLVYDPESQRFL